MDDSTRSARQQRPTCEQCRLRKVRCNRKIPCAHCSRLQLPCKYGKTSRRAPLRAPSKDPPISNLETSPAASEDEPFREIVGEPSNLEIMNRLSTVETRLDSLITSLGADKLPNHPIEGTHPGQQQSPSNDSTRGVLVGNAERGSYVDDSVFVDLLLDNPTRRDNASTTAVQSAHSIPPQIDPSHTLGVIATDVFGPHTESVNVPPLIYSELWEIYVCNVDPVVKVLHIPTAHSLFSAAIKRNSQASDTTMALLYAISFAAVTAISKEKTLSQFGIKRLSLLRYFMYQMDQSLMRAKFLIYPDLYTLQSLVIYLTALRTHDTGRPVWVLVGIAIRLAQSLGLHRDGSRLGLSPFDTEMRYRLWWQLSALDSCAPEDHGFDSTIFDRSQSLRLPLNIDDADLSPAMSILPAAKLGWTEMTFAIANFDICQNLRQAIAATRLVNTQVKEKAIQDAEISISRQWLRFTDPDKSICSAAEAMLRLWIMKSRFNLTLQSWLHKRGNKSTKMSRYHQLPQSIFKMAVDILEYGYLLHSGKLSHEFSWFFRRHPDLYALFLVLHCLKDDPEMQEANRTWKAVDDYCSCLTDFEDAFDRKGRASCVWRILGSLKESARKACHQASDRTSASAVSEGPANNATGVMRSDNPNITQGVPSPPVLLPELHDFMRQGDPSVLNLSDWLDLDFNASNSYIWM